MTRRPVILLAFLCSVGVGACSSPARHVLPDEYADDAVPVAHPGVRYWGDALTSEFEQAALDSVQRELDLVAREGSELAPVASYLALSGGGANGAFGAGLLCGWTAAGDRPEFKLVTGISTGALMAPFAFIGPECDPTLREFYTTIDTKDVLDKGGPLRILFGESAADSAPLAKLIARLVDEKILTRVAEEYREGRMLLVTTADLDADRPVIWDLGKIAASGRPGALELFRSVMLASASIPGVFPPVMIAVEAHGETGDEMHVDGGTCSQVFLFPESLDLKHLAEQVGRTRERRAYVVRNSRLDPKRTAVKRKTLAITARAIEQLIRVQGIGDLYEIYLESIRGGIEFNLAYIPREFDQEPTEEFDPVYMTALFELGEKMAREGYPWQKTPPGLDAKGVPAADARPAGPPSGA